MRLCSCSLWQEQLARMFLRRQTMMFSPQEQPTADIIWAIALMKSRRRKTVLAMIPMP